MTAFTRWVNAQQLQEEERNLSFAGIEGPVRLRGTVR